MEVVEEVDVSASHTIPDVTEIRLVTVRSDHGDGGWSLYPLGTTPAQVAAGAAPLLTGPATWSEDVGDWDRPDFIDCVVARQKARFAAIAKAEGSIP